MKDCIILALAVLFHCSTAYARHNLSKVYIYTCSLDIIAIASYVRSYVCFCFPGY